MSTWMRGLLCCAVVLWMPALASAQGARLQLDKLARLNAQASEVTDITLDPAMLQLAGNFLSDPNGGPGLKELLSGLKGVYVKTYKFDRADAYTPADVEGVRSQLTGNWVRLVSTQTKKEDGREIVEVYSWREGERMGGLAILVAEPRELTVVNIVGPIDLNRLAGLQGQLGIPNVPIK
ncbi:MAG TPA: DUF4252 domain-containing protein [Vicinamibacterales bacterium]|nr:DUF4252 domain-containing protein [Vicinamibacterales bacterium]